MTLETRLGAKDTFSQEQEKQVKLLVLAVLTALQYSKGRCFVSYGDVDKRLLMETMSQGFGGFFWTSTANLIKENQVCLDARTGGAALFPGSKGLLVTDYSDLYKIRDSDEREERVQSCIRTAMNNLGRGLSLLIISELLPKVESFSGQYAWMNGPFEPNSFWSIELVGSQQIILTRWKRQIESVAGEEQNFEERWCVVEKKIVENK